MTIASQIVAGKTVNNGINDQSIPPYSVSSPTFPLHMPVVTLVTPKGPLAKDKGTTWINLADFTAMFGNVTDHTSPYYNPSALLIQQLRAGGQSTIGVRRVAANDKVARTALSAFVQKKTVQDYERDLAGNFKRNAQGAKIATAKTYTDGFTIVIKPDPDAATKAVGGLTVRTIPAVPAAGGNPAVPETYVFPLFEGIAGVGEAYNSSGLMAGVRDDSVNYRAIAEFVKATGVYPFDLKEFTESASGTRTFAKTADRRETVPFTLIQVDYKGEQYNVKRGFGAYTGTNVNRKVTPRAAPYNDVHVYTDSINALLQTMYAVEKKYNTTLLSVTQLGFEQMNPFTCVNHTGAPYYAIEVGTGGNTWDLSGSVRASGGVHPFYDNAGKLPTYVTVDPLVDPLGVLAAVKFPITAKQAWQVTNELMVGDLTEYLAGTETKNYTRNRQSFFWDVGYTQPVKDLAVQLLASRKDIIVAGCATVWKPGAANTLSEIYSRATGLVNAMRLYPESEKWGTPTCRASINLIEAKLIDEKTDGFFSMNLDLAYAFALFAGNAQGVVKPAFSPDSKKNRELRTMHTPNIEFEEDFTAANNFDIGALTLRVKDSEQLFRPALVTVYNNPDSVLKDLVTTFLCVCIEKIAQDKWNEVCGDTTLSASNYVATFKDESEKDCRNRLGGMAKRITFDGSYNETAPGGRAVMNAIGHAYFNKGKYMMNLDLFAYNEQDLEAA